MFERGNSTGVRSELLNPKKNGCLRKIFYKIEKILICRSQTKSDRRQRLFEKGRKELQYETDALTLLKYVRGLQKLIDIKIKLTNEEAHRVEKAKYKRITIKEDEIYLQQKTRIVKNKVKPIKPFGSLELDDID